LKSSIIHNLSVYHNIYTWVYGRCKVMIQAVVVGVAVGGCS